MSAIKIRDNIYAVGARDPEVRIFHGYATPFGATYNAYLILDGDKRILVDNVKAAFTEEFLQNIEEICPVESLDILIQNHIEPDHSGSFPELIKCCPNIEIYCTAGAQKGLKAYYGWEGACHLVKAGETLNTGAYNFAFMPAPMVHWPDSMLTYLAEEKILFSNDAFGQHICADAMYDDELGEERLFERAIDYYGNIVLPFGVQVTKLLEAASAWEIELICPSHGVMIRKYIGEIIGTYLKWAKNETDPNKVVMIYDSMWGSTEEMTKKICAEFEAEGKCVHVHCLRDEHYSAVMGDIVDAHTICVGASTLNNTLMPTVAAFMAYMKGLKPKGRVGLPYGSYGWSGEATKEVCEVMEKLGWEVLPIRKQVYRG